MDRRGKDRCPVCQGPTRAMENGELRCRNSVCAHNHRQLPCPRCASKQPQVVRFDSNIYYYECKECQNKWSIPAA